MACVSRTFLGPFSLSTALALSVLGSGSGACSSSATPLDVGEPACGNAIIDPDETCDIAIASGASACPSTCDDGDACTTDTLSGAACSVTCEHAPISACKSGDGCCPKGCTEESDDDCVARCGDGVVTDGETCDTGIKSGAGQCPTTCTSTNACQEPVLEGSGCQARCLVRAIVTAKPGDDCCPQGATRATDSDCLGAYGDSCTAGAQCQSGTCFPGLQMCTKACTLTGAVDQCGVPGHFCFEHPSGNVCYPVASTGSDNDDRYVGPGVLYTAKIDFANDKDAFVADLAIGMYTITVTPTDAAPQIDLAVDVYDGSATNVGTGNATGVGSIEIVDYTVGAGGRNVFVVRSVNPVQGSYTIKIVKTS